MILVTLFCDRCGHHYRASYVSGICAICQLADRETLWARPLTGRELRFAYGRALIGFYERAYTVVT